MYIRAALFPATARISLVNTGLNSLVLKKIKTPMRPTRPLVCSALAAIAALVIAPMASALDIAQVGKLNFDSIPSPSISAGKDKGFKPKDWLEVEAEIVIPPQSDEQKKAGFIDEVTVKWYVAVKNREGKGMIKLMKEIEHINIPVNEPIYSSVYLSPATIHRLTGQDRAGKTAVEVVGLEVFIAGTKVGQATSKMSPGWWEAPSLSDQSSKYPLLNKNETPFAVFWYDRYAEIKEKK
jgi:hypothetical protein